MAVTTEVVARPVSGRGERADSYFRANRKTPNAMEQLVEGLSGLQPGLAAIAEQDRQRKEKALAGQGVQDAVAGKGKQSDYVAYWDAYDDIQAKKGLALFQGELAEVFTKAKQEEWDTEQWQQTYSQLVAKYTEGQPDTFVEKFAPAALNVLGDANWAFGKFQQELVERDVLESSHVIARSLIEELVYSEESPATWGKTLRSSLDELQDKAKAINGIPRDKVTGVFMSALDQVAELYRLPELYAVIDEPGTGGVTIRDTRYGKDAVNRFMALESSVKSYREDMAVQKGYNTLNEMFTKGGKMDFWSATEALYDPSFVQKLGLNQETASKLQQYLFTAWSRHNQVEAEQLEQSTKATLNKVFDTFFANDSATALDVLLKSNLPGHKKYEIWKNLGKGEVVTNAVAFNNAIEMIKNGQLTHESSILQEFNGKWSIEDGKKLLNFMELVRGPEGQLVKNTIEAIEKGMSKATLMASDTFETKERIAAALQDFIQRIEQARKEGKPITPMLTIGSPEYIVDKIVHHYEMTPDEEIKAMMRKFNPTKAEQADVADVLSKTIPDQNFVEHIRKDLKANGLEPSDVNVLRAFEQIGPALLNDYQGKTKKSAPTEAQEPFSILPSKPSKTINRYQKEFSGYKGFEFFPKRKKGE
jgi:hypothetical protein